LDECFNFDFKQARILDAIEKKRKQLKSIKKLLREAYLPIKNIYRYFSSLILKNETIYEIRYLMQDELNEILNRSGVSKNNRIPAEKL